MITYETFAASAAKLATLDVGWKWVCDEEHSGSSLVSFLTVITPPSRLRSSPPPTHLHSFISSFRREKAT